MRATVHLRRIEGAPSTVTVEALLVELSGRTTSVSKALLHGPADEALRDRHGSLRLLVDGARAFASGAGTSPVLFLERSGGRARVSVLATAGVGVAAWRMNPARPVETVPYRPRAKLVALEAAHVEIPLVALGRHAISLSLVRRATASGLVGASHAALDFLAARAARDVTRDGHTLVAEAVAIRREVARATSSVAMVEAARGQRMLLAASDPIALDAVAARLLALDPFAVPYVRVAHESGVGVGDLRDIDVVGDVLPAAAWAPAGRASGGRLS